MKFSTKTLYAAVCTAVAIIAQAAALDIFRPKSSTILAQASSIKALSNESSRLAPQIRDTSECTKKCNHEAYKEAKEAHDAKEERLVLGSWLDCVVDCKDVATISEFREKLELMCLAFGEV
ncbi:uncharacterized protein ALTATR162_LOCUS7545 [Alternaria atra]|uniref:Uncharacterized protein n=1 Tax=Alternaria atra TaxID=119953 RepID=A0A8J2IDI1_9PLEO|nr:uncharacterized protein ALTATR162_LOCUS7545 [Alternaria atra]CAG5172914.1 unnamed protein product [Alternaria atra]